MRYVIIGGSAAAIGCIEGSAPWTKPATHSHYKRDGVELFPPAHFVSAGGQDHAGQNVVPAGQLFYPERCDGESRRAGHRAGCRRQGPCGSLQASGWLTTGCWRPRGSRPFVPPIPGLETVERTFCFQTLSDASALAEALRPESRVLILGAGLTGVKCARGHPRPVRADRHCGPCAPRAACCTG